ncbi:hypothetical protein [Marinimicrobium alkaliphilum]|uniref:hypothetical protein n=1 Tax=Marinimicrobium alkaliphilum TaxID=2202654 RepID=UPI000DBA32D4|nr:hypothetical protein [Marinimicrobium alkaliphilum]
MANLRGYPLGAVMLVVLFGGLTACGGSSGSDTPPGGTNGNGNGNGNSNGNGDPEPTLATIQQTIFSPICATCHTGAGAPEGLRLDSEQASYDHLVEQPAQGVPALMRVDPGNPDDSYLVRKLEGGPDIVGDRMPQGGASLSSAQIALIRDWIANGAAREGTGDGATGVVLAGVEDSASGVELTWRFSRSLAEHAQDPHTWQVYLRTDGATRPLTSDEYSYWLDERALILNLPTQADATLEVLFNDPASGLWLDHRGRVIDGDGDGQDGGRYRYVYPH